MTTKGSYGLQERTCMILRSSTDSCYACYIYCSIDGDDRIASNTTIINPMRDWFVL